MIIRAGDIDYMTTSHAEAKMLFEGVSPEQVALVLENGTFDYTPDGEEIYRYQIGKRLIAVVIVEGTERIKTVFIVRK